jgi:carbon monoxide dehydrogenase subunit G
MEMTGQYRIPAPRAKVWAALNDPVVLKECIPGCQSLDKLSETEMAATVKSKVGPVSATFQGQVTLSNVDPPNGYTISGEGKGGVAGFARGGADVKLADDGDGMTLLSYTAKAQVGGKLAQIGARLIDATARQMADQFFGAFARKVGALDEFAEVEHKVEAAVQEVEERAEVAAAKGVLGGPQMWALLALAAVIVILLIFFR